MLQLFEPMSDEELLAGVSNPGWSSMKKDIARAVINERAEARAAVRANQAMAEAALAERSVQAAEKQATYAKRAYQRSNVAIGVSIVAIILTALLAVLDFISKP